MTDSSLTQLKVLVERAVRPVRASTSRKRAMREELLGHVTAVHAEELAVHGEEAAALERTAARFGDPAQLTAQLQASLPLGERLEWFFEQRFGYRLGESALHRAGRHALWLGGLSVGGLVLGWFIRLARGRLVAWPAEPLLWSAIILALVCGGFALTLLIEGLRRALYGPAGRSWAKVIGFSFAGALYFPVALTAVSLLANGGSPRLAADLLLWTLPASLLFAVAFVVLACFTARDIRHAEEWGSLKLD